VVTVKKKAAVAVACGAQWLTATGSSLWWCSVLTTTGSSFSSSSSSSYSSSLSLSLITWVLKSPEPIAGDG